MGSPQVSPSEFGSGGGVLHFPVGNTQLLKFRLNNLPHTDDNFPVISHLFNNFPANQIGRIVIIPKIKKKRVSGIDSDFLHCFPQWFHGKSGYSGNLAACPAIAVISCHWASVLSYKNKKIGSWLAYSFYRHRFCMLHFDSVLVNLEFYE
jgi:hypothetical protein